MKQNMKILLNKGLTLLVSVVMFALPFSGHGQTTIKTFAVLADFGCDGANELAVTSLVKAWDPAFIICPGDVHYGNDPLSPDWDCANTTIDDNVGKYLADYLYPYTGTYARSSSAPNQNRFYPVPGNHDYQTPISTWENYFSHTDPGTNSSHSKRYYDFKIDIGDGDQIHFFGLNTNEMGTRTGCTTGSPPSFEPCNPAKYDSIDENSSQYNWLKTQLAASDAMFKIVFLHMSPYGSLEPGSSDKASKDKLKAWKFREWGADIVLAGDDHYYERNWRQDMGFIIAGLGGHEMIKHIDKANITTGNIVHYEKNFGALKADVIRPPSGKKDIHFQFININGDVIDDFYLLPKKSVAFNFEGSSMLTDEVQGITAEHADNYLPADGYDGATNSAISFIDNGSVILPPILKEYMDASGDGYTISCWVKAEPGSTSQIFWGTDKTDKVAYGFKRKQNFISIDRYIDWVNPRGHWEFDTWNPDLFAANSQWHRIMISVKDDMTRIKIYRPHETVTGEGMGYDGHTELTYMGGQRLDEFTLFGFGHFPGGSPAPVDVLDNFWIYDQAFDFKKMDDVFIQDAIDEPAQEGGRIAADEEPKSQEEERKQIAIYPNPAREELNIETNGDDASQLQIVNILGVSFTKQTIPPGKITLNISQLSRGLYYVIIEGNSKSKYIKKIIID